MADEAQPQPAGEGSAENAAAPKARGGFSAYLPLIIALVLMPAAAWLTIEFKFRQAAKQSGTPQPTEKAEGEESHAETDAHAPAADSHGGGHGGHGATTATTSSRRSTDRDPRIPVPITSSIIGFQKASTQGESGMYVIYDHKGETKDIAKPTDIIVNIAGTAGTRYCVVSLYVIGRDASLVSQINANRALLIDRIHGHIQSKTLPELERVAAKTLLRQELIEVCNRVLGAGMIQDVAFEKFVFQ